MAPEECREMCPYHSGFEAKIDAMIKHAEISMTEHNKIWDAIANLQTRPPVWTTILISLLSGALGAVTTALIAHLGS